MMFPEGAQLLDSLNAKVIGSGDEVLVLAHGFGSNQSMWETILPSLLNTGNIKVDTKVVLFDLPGSATTNPDDFDFSLYESYYGFADTLLALLRHLQVKNCVYVGHSMSGMIGCIAAIKQPELFDKIVLLGASPRYLNDRDYYGGFEKEDVEQLFEAMRCDFKGWACEFAPLVVGVSDKDAIDRFTETLSSMRPDVALAIAKTIFESDHRWILPEVKVATHILQTTKDLAVPMVVADYMSRNLGSKGTIEVLQTEGHLPQITSPELLITSLKKLLHTKE